MFELRDALSGSGFSGRANDVFSALGSESVKTTEKSTNKDNSNRSFEEHQLERSMKQTNKRQQPTTTTTVTQKSHPDNEQNLNLHSRRDTDDDDAGDAASHQFKHPAQFLRPEHRKHGDRRQLMQQSGNDRKQNWTGSSRGARQNRQRPYKANNRVPDFRKNPDNWTLYSLADTDDLTERGNTAAALQFLQTLRKPVVNTEESSNSANESGKIVFKKPVKNKRAGDALTAKSERSAGGDDNDVTAQSATAASAAASSRGFGFVGSKIVQHEYIAGTKPSKKSASKAALPNKSAALGSGTNTVSLKLSHLDDEVDDD